MGGSSYARPFFQIVGWVCFTTMLAGIYIIGDGTTPISEMLPGYPSRATVPPKVAEISTTTKTMLRRGQLLNQRCQELRGLITPTATTVPKSVQEHIIVNDRYNVMFCWIPKIACTNFKRMFLLLSEKLNQSESVNISHKEAQDMYAHKYLRSLRQYDELQINYRLKYYTKIMFVREPFQRFLSAYRDKFDTGTEYWARTDKFARSIKRNVRKNNCTKGDVTFDEFVRYVISQDTQRKVLNQHWNEYTRICQPCTVRYDLIGKYSSLEDDGNAFLDDIGAPRSIRFPERQGNHSKTADMMQQFYKDIDSVDLRKLKTIYANDSYLFDYGFPSVLEPYLNQSEKEATEQLPM